MGGRRVPARAAAPAAMLVGDWLQHWVESIAAPAIRPKTLAAYRSAVYCHLIPGIGQLRLDTLEPEHIEAMDAALLARGLAPGTVHQAHQTLRTALAEAVERGRLQGVNPASKAKLPRVIEAEIQPFTVAETQAILLAAGTIRGGCRFALALALGLRQGEALGLEWQDFALDSTGPAVLTIRRALQRVAWQHGCQATPCGRPRSASCPQRHGGGLRLVPPKSRAGQRTIVLPGPLVQALRQHRDEQARERAGCLDWPGGDLVFTGPTGEPIDPRRDLEHWKELLRLAGVRDARLHDARHTAATLLLLQGVDPRTVMDLLGWSQVTMTRRYQHVVTELRVTAAQRIEDLLWGPGILTPQLAGAGADRLGDEPVE